MSAVARAVESRCSKWWPRSRANLKLLRASNLFQTGSSGRCPPPVLRPWPRAGHSSARGRTRRGRPCRPPAPSRRATLSTLAAPSCRLGRSRLLKRAKPLTPGLPTPASTTRERLSSPPILPSRVPKGLEQLQPVARSNPQTSNPNGKCRRRREETTTAARADLGPNKGTDALRVSSAGSATPLTQTVSIRLQRRHSLPVFHHFYRNVF